MLAQRRRVTLRHFSRGRDARVNTWVNMPGCHGGAGTGLNAFVSRLHSGAEGPQHVDWRSVQCRRKLIQADILDEPAEIKAEMVRRTNSDRAS
jgi:hypothetical protein